MNINKIARRVLSVLPDKQYIQLQYRYITGRKLNLDHPTRFNEKLQWLKLYDRNPGYPDLVDKYKAKRVIGELIGKEYIVPLLGVWSDPSEINENELPDQFVLKTNHDSKGVAVCKDKASFDFDKAKDFLGKRLKHNGYSYGREWPYKNIKPRIIAEKYLEDESGGLNDYKVMCFNGKAKLIQLHQGRYSDSHTQDIYDLSWNLQPFNQINETSSNTPVPKPVFLDEMIRLSEIIAENIPQVRVDWYYAEGQLYFGEVTFFDGSGYYDFIPDEMNEILGSWITLPDRR